MPRRKKIVQFKVIQIYTTIFTLHSLIIPLSLLRFKRKKSMQSTPIFLLDISTFFPAILISFFFFKTNDAMRFKIRLLGAARSTRCSLILNEKVGLASLEKEEEETKRVVSSTQGLLGEPRVRRARNCRVSLWSQVYRRR